MTGAAVAWNDVSTQAVDVAFFAYLAAMVGSFHFLAFRRPLVRRGALALTMLGATAHLVALVGRGIAADRLPIGNMYEYSLLLTFLLVVAYLVGVERIARVRTLGGFVLAFVVLTLAVAVVFLYVGPAPLVPALDSYWRTVHVTAMIVSSSLLALGSIVTILYLWQERRERRGAATPAPIMGGSIGVEDAPPHFEVDVARVAPERVGAGRLPSAAALDALAYRILSFAFPLWTFGIISGAIWAEDAWGRYWGWDPKETWSFITWTIFAGYLHARTTSGWRGRRAAVIALVGFVSLLITYYAVNLWIVGLHSYAGVS
jgi:cytochrome c-type biogenesis protein CcsB